MSACVCSAVSIGASAAGRRVATVPDRAISWLEFGDSYSSGEGIPDAGPPCARSTQAYAPVAANLLRQQRGWTINPEVFVACTGDVSAALFNPKPALGGDPGHPSQVDLAIQAGWLAGAKADIVSFSFGGNDIRFADVIKSCIDFPTSWGDLGSTNFVGRQCPPTIDNKPFEQGLGQRINDVRATLKDLYQRALNELVAPGGVLVVVGYPRLFAPSGDWGAWRGGRCAGMSAGDADTLGRLSNSLEQTLKNAVAEVDPSATKMVYISRLDLYDQGVAGSHSLCGGQTEWLNRITVGAYDPQYRGERSFHPNVPGHAATAEVIANTLAAWFEPPPPAVTTTPLTPTTSPPPIVAAGKFEKGDEFLSDCVVAWPTAPTYTSDAIEMTMSCSGVPNQFLFVDVTYPDPNLPINPSTGRVRVHGQIVDIAESAYGFRELVVLADKIDL
jgi:hypothetical protein